MYFPIRTNFGIVISEVKFIIWGSYQWFNYLDLKISFRTNILFNNFFEEDVSKKMWKDVMHLNEL